MNGSKVLNRVKIAAHDSKTNLTLVHQNHGICRKLFSRLFQHRHCLGLTPLCLSGSLCQLQVWGVTPAGTNPPMHQETDSVLVSMTRAVVMMVKASHNGKYFPSYSLL